MKDKWCARIKRKNQSDLTGGAARNWRIARSGGMSNIINDVARNAAQEALNRANQLSDASTEISAPTVEPQIHKPTDSLRVH